MHVAKVLLIASIVLIASCGDSGLPPVPDGGVAAPGAGVYAAPPPQPPPLSGSGRLMVTVTDRSGQSLANAQIVAYGTGRATDVYFSDQRGMTTIEDVPAMVRVCVNHPYGHSCKDRVDVAQSGVTALSVVMEPATPVTAALLPVTVKAGGLSADRSVLDLRVSFFASASASFSRTVDTGGSTAPVYLRLDNCSVNMDFVRNLPTCVYYGDSRRQVSVLDYAYDPFVTPTPLAPVPYSALLLLDQSQRAMTYDPDDLRTRAVKRFIERARTGPQADLIAVAGFAGQGASAASPALLPHLPLWAPPGSTTLFSSETLAHAAAVETLRPLVGGNSPVLEALQSALTLTATQAPASGRRAIVALLGGGDDSGLTESQRKQALALLRQQQVDTGIQVILVVSRLDEKSGERERVAELAAALSAPIIFAGYPANWLWPTDGLYYALDLAADLVAGAKLPGVSATFRLISDRPGGFQAGSTLHGTVWIESDNCPMGCGELPFQFAVEIP